MRPHIGAALLLISATACAGLDHFEHTLTDEATIPGMINMSAPFALNYSGGAFTGVDLSKSESFANAGVEADDVDAIYIKQIRVEGTHAQIDRLDVIFNSVVLWVEAPGVPKQVVGSKYVFERSNQTSLEVIFTETGEAINLKPYATAESMTVGTDVNIKQPPQFETTIRTTITLLIDINLPG
jgi:hypothetical protein